ncbi:MAG: hypothetical protein H6851_06395 [Geminicoccaceae bacterium]|nr:hypothetical protein [Geminicoccaceae bacterium]MCB9943236.1 hypothetical protein [Geminicoccaceae bacterium]
MVLAKLLGGSRADSARDTVKQDNDEGQFALYPPRTPSGLNPLDFGDFARRIEAFRKVHVTLPDQRTKGCLQIFELDRVRYRFGLRWPAIKEKAFQMIESALHRSLGEHDVYVANGETEIYVLSTRLVRADADLRGRLIASEITGRLCGSVPGGTAIRVKTMPFDFGLGLKDITSFQQLKNRIESYGKSIDSAEVKLFNENVAGMRIRYRPTIAFQDQKIRLYHADIVLRENDGTILPVDVVCPESVNGAFDFEVDKWALDQMPALLETAAMNSEQPVIVLPIHFETLAAMRFRDPFIDKCRTLPDCSVDTLYFEIIGIPPSMPQARVRELMAYIKPYCAEIVARLPSDLIVAEHVESCGIGVLSIDLGTVDPEAESTHQKLRKFSEMARTLAMTPMLTNAWSVSLSHVAYKSGISLLNGDAFMPPTSKPGNVVDLTAGS